MDKHLKLLKEALDDPRIYMLDDIFKGIQIEGKTISEISSFLDSLYTFYFYSKGAKHIYNYIADYKNYETALDINKYYDLNNQCSVIYSDIKSDFNNYNSDIALVFNSLIDFIPKDRLFSDLNRSIKDHIYIEAPMKQSRRAKDHMRSMDDNWNFYSYESLERYLLKQLFSFNVLKTKRYPKEGNYCLLFKRFRYGI